MTTLTIDKAMLELLRQVNGPAEIRDENGAFVGVFSPACVPSSGQGRRKMRTPEEEQALLADLERRAKDPDPDCTFREAFEHLLALTSDPIEQATLREQIEHFAERENDALHGAVAK